MDSREVAQAVDGKEVLDAHFWAAHRLWAFSQTGSTTGAPPAFWPGFAPSWPFGLSQEMQRAVDQDVQK